MQLSCLFSANGDFAKIHNDLPCLFGQYIVDVAPPHGLAVVGGGGRVQEEMLSWVRCGLARTTITYGGWMGGWEEKTQRGVA